MNTVTFDESELGYDDIPDAEKWAYYVYEYARFLPNIDQLVSEGRGAFGWYDRPVPQTLPHVRPGCEALAEYKKRMSVERKSGAFSRFLDNWHVANAGGEASHLLVHLVFECPYFPVTPWKKLPDAVRCEWAERIPERSYVLRECWGAMAKCCNADMPGWGWPISEMGKICSVEEGGYLPFSKEWWRIYMRLCEIVPFELPRGLTKGELLVGFEAWLDANPQVYVKGTGRGKWPSNFLKKELQALAIHWWDLKWQGAWSEGRELLPKWLPDDQSNWIKVGNDFKVFQEELFGKLAFRFS